jgi:uncharacterized membrane protein YfcA
VLEKFEQAWRLQDHGKKDTLQQQMNTLLAQLERERRRSRIVLTICGTYTILTTVAITIILTQRDVPFKEVWPAFGAQCVAIAVLAWVGRKRLEEERESASKTASVRDAAAAALRSTNTDIRTARLVAMAMTAMLVLMVLALRTLYTSGKIDERALSGLIPLILLIAVFNGLVLWRRWTRKFRPRRDRLSRMLRDLDSE